MTGKIDKLTDKGFGFIIDDATGDTKGIFFHSQNVVGTTYNELAVGDAVSFETAMGDKGLFATNVTRI